MTLKLAPKTVDESAAYLFLADGNRPVLSVGAFQVPHVLRVLEKLNGIKFKGRKLAIDFAA